MVKLQTDATSASDFIQHPQTFRHDFCANAVSGDDSDAVCVRHDHDSLGR
jgi:hypothetical protein